MALYALGDTHLSLSTDKPMDIFGGNWNNYVEKLKIGLSILTEDDVCVLCGDISWSMSLEGSAADFEFLGGFPGKKIVLKGNHDYWWTTASKIKRHWESLGLYDFELLHNNFHAYGDAAICGTRGWFFEEETGSEHDRKIMLRELGRLETSLKQAGEREKHVFLHYPPLYGAYRCDEILDLFEKYEVKSCTYGHIHGRGHRQAVEGERYGVVYRMVSADYIFFTPMRIL